MALWNINKVIAQIQKFSNEPEREIINLAGWVWEEGMMFSKEKELDFSPNEEEKIENILTRLQLGEPIQYIVGHAWFYGLKMTVSPAVLIPRPETEELVEWIIENHFKTEKPLRILDIGTGSGCIAIAIKHRLKSSAHVIAVDISRDALEVAKINAYTHGTDIEFVQFDFLNGALADLGIFDIIVSNPPYISRMMVDEKLFESLSFEPELALYPENGDPDAFYSKLSRSAPGMLHSGGACYLEMNEYRASEIENYFHQLSWKFVETRRDMQGKPRMIKIVKS